MVSRKDADRVYVDILKPPSILSLTRPEDDMDVTCPKPTVPRPNSRAGTPANDDDASSNPQPPGGAGAAGATDDHDGSPPPTKKKRIRTCRTCRREGHDSRNCPDKP